MKLQISLLLGLGYLLAACGGLEQPLEERQGKTEVDGQLYLICNQSFKATLFSSDYTHYRLPPSSEDRTVTVRLDAKFDSSVGAYLGVSLEEGPDSFIFIDGMNTKEEDHLEISFSALSGEAYRIEVATTDLDGSDTETRTYTLQTICE